MLRFVGLFISIVLILTPLTFSETVVLAQDDISYNMPKYKTKSLDFAKQQNIMISCSEPENIIEVIIDNETKILKDSNYNLAFVSGGSVKNISMEDYLIGVTLSEIPHTFELEAIKAQAVAARTYALTVLENESRHGVGKICGDSSHCSGYITKDEFIRKYGEAEYLKAYDKIKNAVNETDGVIITYDDKPCCAVFHSSSNANTEDSSNLWGTETPYLKSVKSYENAAESKMTVDIDSMNSFLSFFGKTGISPGSILITYNSSGRCDEVTVNNVTVSANKLRNYFGLKSCDFELTYSEGVYSFSVLGYGHGIGLSQFGANEMAKNGHNYIDILLHYYTDVKIDTLD